MIDYLTISFRKSDYRLKSSQNWILRRGNIVASENKSLDDNVFEMDNLTLKGHSMILNSDSFKINETPSGLYIQFNPSSYAYQGINFRTASYSEFVHCIDEIKSRLKEVVELDFESGTLHRIDLAKDIYPHFDFSYYIPVFQCLEGNRNSRNQKLGSTYWWSNEHKEVQFYDKKAQLKNLIPKLRGLTALQTQTWNELKQYNQILRVEVKLKKNYLIVRELKIETLAELLVPSIYDGLQDHYKRLVRTMVLSKGIPYFSQETLSNSDLLEEMIKLVGERQAVKEWLILLGLESTLQKLGGIEGFKSCLHGRVEKGTVSKQCKKIKERLEMLRTFKMQNESEVSKTSITGLYQELIDRIMK